MTAFVSGMGRWRTALVVAVACALYASGFALRLVVEDPNALISLFYSVPIALLAMEWGKRGGVAAAAVAELLVFVWVDLNGVELDTLSYLSRAAAFFVLGLSLGHFADRLRADITRRMRAEEELAGHAGQLAVRGLELERSNQGLRRAVLRLEAFASIAQAVGGETELRRVLDLILTHTRQITQGDSLAILLLDGDHLVVSAVDGLPGANPGARLHVEGTGFSQAIHSGSPARFPDPEEDWAVLGELGLTAHCGLVVPMAYRGAVLGVLIAARPASAGTVLTEEEAALMRSVASSAATAVVTAQSVAEERLRHSIQAAEDGRARWARELHDDTLQGLGALRMLLASALDSRSPGAIASAAVEAVDALGLEIENLRLLITELRPAALDDLGLGPALEALAERREATSGLEIGTSIDLPRGRHLSPEVESAVYRLVQESLTNVVKHARAESASISVAERGGELEVSVTDDGQGFDPATVPAGFGLTGMDERTRLVGGRLEVRSSPGGPTVVRAVVPAEAAAEPPLPLELAAAADHPRSDPG